MPAILFFVKINVKRTISGVETGIIEANLLVLNNYLPKNFCNSKKKINFTR